MNEREGLTRVGLATAVVAGAVFGAAAQPVEAPSWRDFVEKRARGEISSSVLPDFSYAGYHFSEKPLPDVSSWNRISVVDHGARPNDGVYDDDGVRAAIAAAEASDGPTVVYFPAGKYLVSDKANERKPFVIRRGHIVLKGAGTGPNGSEIHTDKRGNHPWRFRFTPAQRKGAGKLAVVTKAIKRGDFRVVVNDASKLKPGQPIQLTHRDPRNLEPNMPGKRFSEEWRIGSAGIVVAEKHLIERINGDVVTFKNPVQLNIPADVAETVIEDFPVIEEVGVEDLIFSSGWKSHPEEFVHHKNKLVDYAWRALSFQRVMNGWIRNCEFRDWNEVLEIDHSLAVTARDIVCSGKRGHSGYFARGSYGVLFERCVDTANIHHGPGFRFATTASVCRSSEMNKEQSIDCHGNNPYCNLIENVSGGRFDRNGGALQCYPNGGMDLVFWNFVHDINDEPLLYDFWSTEKRKLCTYPDPKFIGLRTPGAAVEFINEGLDELRDQEVYPRSLFDAQLQLRLHGGYMSAASSATPDGARRANDRDAKTAWTSEGAGVGQWLMLDFGVARTIRSVHVQEEGALIDSYTLEGQVGDEWRTLAEGSRPAVDIRFDPVSARKVRFTIRGATYAKAPIRISEMSAK